MMKSLTLKMKSRNMKTWILLSLGLSFSFPLKAHKAPWEEGSYLIRNYTKENPRKRPSENPGGKFHSLNSETTLEYYDEIPSSTIGSKVLQAVDVDPDSNGNLVLAGYNYSGEPKLGAIQLIQIEPEVFLNSEIIFLKSDVNTIYQTNSRVYFAGSDQNGAFYSYATINEDSFERVSSKTYLSGYVATDIVVKNNKTLVTTGGNGGVYFFSETDDELQWFYEIPHARSVLYSPWTQRVRVLAGEPGKLYRLDSNGELIYEKEIGGALTPHSKSTLVFGYPFLYATVGESGVKVLCDGDIIGSIDCVELPDTLPANTVTNSADSQDNYLFTGNGTAGVYLYLAEEVKDETSENSCSSSEITELGHYQFNGNTSINHVASDENYVFVASGKGGIKILKLEENQGTPSTISQ